jgi:hypothetical protein
LDLSIRDLRNWYWCAGGCGSLNLSIGDLRDWDSSGGLDGSGLDLAVGDLGDWDSSWAACVLKLSIRDLRDNTSSGSGSWAAGDVLDLSVRDLRNNTFGWLRSDSSTLDLTITDLKIVSTESNEKQSIYLRNRSSWSASDSNLSIARLASNSS